jgi:hypothetical protein
MGKTLHSHEVSIRISEKYFAQRACILGEFEMKVKQFLAACVIGFMGLLQLREAAAVEYSFVDVLFPGANETVVAGINDVGTIVGTYGSTIDVLDPLKLGSKGFVRTGNQWQTLEATGMGLPGVSPGTQAAAINNNNIVVGQYLTSANLVHGFVYNGTSYTDILPPTALEATVSDIDNNGVIIGSYSTNNSLSNPDPNSLDVHGFRGLPNGMGGYTYELFDFPGATSTFGSGRNDFGAEVGSAIVQDILGNDQFGYILPDHEYRYPAESEFTIGTELFNIRNDGVILGSTTILQIDETTFTLTGHTKGFLINADDFGGPNPPTPTDIILPGPACGYIVHFDGTSEEACRRAAASINSDGLIVGYYDNNDAILRGFIGTPIEVDTGDFNNDGSVDAADYVVWRKGLGSTYTQDDFNVWRAHFGETVGSGSITNSTVPEPATCLLLICLISTSTLSRDRRIRKVALNRGSIIKRHKLAPTQKCEQLHCG